MSDRYDREPPRKVYRLSTPVPIEETVIEGELVDGSPSSDRREQGGADRVVAVAMAVTVTGIAVVGLLNFLSSDPEPEEPKPRKGRRR